MLQETKSLGHQAKKIVQRNWRSVEVIEIDAQGYSRGMALAWNRETIQMETYWTTKRTTTENFHYRWTNIKGFITSVYGPNIPKEKQQFLEEIHYTSTLVETTYWIVGGDFNKITSLSEKKGGLR